MTRPSLQELFPEKARRIRALRNEVIREAFVEHGYRLKEIGDHIGLHYTAVSRIIKEWGR